MTDTIPVRWKYNSGHSVQPSWYCNEGLTHGGIVARVKEMGHGLVSRIGVYKPSREFKSRREWDALTMLNNDAEVKQFRIEAQNIGFAKMFIECKAHPTEKPLPETEGDVESDNASVEEHVHLEDDTYLEDDAAVEDAYLEDTAIVQSYMEDDAPVEDANLEDELIMQAANKVDSEQRIDDEEMRYMADSEQGTDDEDDEINDGNEFDKECITARESNRNFCTAAVDIINGLGLDDMLAAPGGICNDDQDD